jgi:hypothetical protein
MSSLTTSQRQQRLTNVLLAGNLYKAHKIGKQLTEITALHKMSLGVSIANLKVNMHVLAQIKNLNQKMERQEAEKRKIKLLKDIFFQITEEIEDIEERKSYPLEKYFLLLSLKAEMEKNEIDTSLADDLSEKKMISSTIKELNKKIENLEKKFSQKEKDEQEQILGVLEVDEESKINELENNQNSKVVRDIKNLSEFMIDYYKENLTHFISMWKNQLSNEKLFNKVKNGEKISLKSYDIPTNEEEEGFDSVSLWNEVFTNIYKKLTHKQFNQIKKLEDYASIKFSIFEKMKSSYKNLVKKLEDENGETPNSMDIQKAYFYNKNKKIIDEVFKLVINSIKNSFKSNQSAHLDEKKTVKKLKGDIQKEKDLVKQIYKKHKFVEKILASRV